MHLGVQGLIAARMRVNVVSLHILTIDATANRRIRVAVTVRMEWRFGEVRLQCRVRQPARGQLQLGQFVIEFFHLFIGQIVQLILLNFGGKDSISPLACTMRGHVRGGSALL